MTDEAGVGERRGRALGVIALDVTDDGLIDLYITNDLHANSLFINQGNGRFQDTSEFSGTAYDSVGNAMSSMGVDAADVNGNGRFDILVTHFQREYNVLYMNMGNAIFQDISYKCGMAMPSLPFVGWGLAFADFDLDGWSDVVVTNGHVDDNRALLGQNASLAMRPLALRNTGGSFEQMGVEAGPYFQKEYGGRGMTVADLDDDGDQDLVFNHRDGDAALVRNERLVPGDQSRRSVVLRLVGTLSNRDAVGAAITLRAGERTKLEQVKGGGLYQSARDLRQFMALLDREEEVQFEIRWPSGKRSVLSTVRPGQTYLVIEPADESTTPRVVAKRFSRGG
ncbi:MAG: CRTAC1 family protein [Pirellulales bacterium]